MNQQQKKYAIYTAMVGGYDEIMQPKVVDDRFDYILFSNDIQEDRVGVWQVRPIAYNNPDNTRICRYVKTHPEELLQGYEASVWMDSNIRIMTSAVYERIIELYESGSLIASMNHPERDCIYDEAFTVLACGFEKERIVIDWCHKLRKEKYPRHNGLYETNVMFRKHNTSLISKTNVMWWDSIEKYSKRDQLSFNYVLWRLGVECDFFMDKSLCARNSKYFQYINHKNDKSKFHVNNKHEAWLVRYYKKMPSSYEQIKLLYYKIYGYRFPQIWAYLVGQYYRIHYKLISRKHNDSC